MDKKGETQRGLDDGWAVKNRGVEGFHQEDMRLAARKKRNLWVEQKRESDGLE